MAWIVGTFAVIGVVALIVAGVLVAAINCTDKDFGCTSIEEWKDGRIKPYSHVDDI